MKHAENATRIAELRGIWAAVELVKEDPRLEIDGLDEDLAVSMAQCEAEAEDAAPSMAPEAWFAREEAVRELVQMDEHEEALGFLRPLDEFNTGNLLFAIADEMIKTGNQAAPSLLQERGVIGRIGHSRMATLWASLYVKTQKVAHLNMAMRSCKASANEYVRYGAVHPYMEVWQITGSVAAREAAALVASNHPELAVQVKAHHIIGEFTGDAKEFLRAFEKARSIDDQGTRIGLVRAVITTIVCMAIHLIEGMPKGSPTATRVYISREQLDHVLRNMPHERWELALRQKLKGIGVAV